MIKVYWHLFQFGADGKPAWRLYRNFGSLEFTDADRLKRYAIANGCSNVDLVRAS